MSFMPNVHVRDLPPETVETLRDAAKRNGRSLNAEIVAALERAAQREIQSRDLVQRTLELRRNWSKTHPEGYPPGLEPETIIRRHRDGG
jgi:plasmid stability protein